MLTFSIFQFLNIETTFAEKILIVPLTLVLFVMGYTFFFIVSFVYWFPLALFMRLHPEVDDLQNWKQGLLLTSNLLICAIFILMSFWCSLDYSCYSEGSLSSGGGVITWFFLSLLFVTRPFILFFDFPKASPPAERAEEK